MLSRETYRRMVREARKNTEGKIAVIALGTVIMLRPHTLLGIEEGDIEVARKEKVAVIRLRKEKRKKKARVIVVRIDKEPVKSIKEVVVEMATGSKKKGSKSICGERGIKKVGDITKEMRRKVAEWGTERDVKDISGRSMRRTGCHKWLKAGEGMDRISYIGGWKKFSSMLEYLYE